MPPLPVTLNEEIVSIIDSLRRRRQDLSGLQIQRLRTCTGPLTVQQQYAAELREDLDAFARQVEVCLFLDLYGSITRISE